MSKFCQTSPGYPPLNLSKMLTIYSPKSLWNMYLILQQEVSNLFQVFHSVKVIKINSNPIRRVTVFNQIILLLRYLHLVWQNWLNSL